MASLAAILAIGNPVALDASAEDRDTRGFISMTTIRPVRGWTANWMLQPPVSTPTARTTAIATSRMCWYSRSVRVIAGAMVTESPVCTPIGSMFSIEQTTTTLSLRSRISSSSNSFQPRMDSSSSTSVTGLASSPDPAMRRRSAASCAMPEPAPPRVNEGRITTGHPSPPAARRPLALLQAVAHPAGGHLGAEPSDDLLEPAAVLPRGDRVDVGPDQLHPVPGQHAGLVQGDGGVQRGLAAQRGQHRVGPLDRDDLFQHLCGDRLHVGGVGELGVGHDRRGVGVDQADPDPLGAQHPAGLNAQIVELAGLANHDKTEANDQHQTQV